MYMGYVYIIIILVLVGGSDKVVGGIVLMLVYRLEEMNN